MYVFFLTTTLLCSMDLGEAKRQVPRPSAHERPESPQPCMSITRAKERSELTEVDKGLKHIEPRNQRRYRTSGSPSKKAMGMKKSYA